MKTLIYVIVLVLSIVAVGCTQRIVEVTFEFDAPGDNGTVGQAFGYDIRYSTDSDILQAWDNAKQVIGEPIPNFSGTVELFTIPVDSLLGETVYYFAIKTSDEVPNWSPISNIVSITTSDWTAPNAIMTFKVRF